MEIIISEYIIIPREYKELAVLALGREPRVNEVCAKAVA